VDVSVLGRDGDVEIASHGDVAASISTALELNLSSASARFRIFQVMCQFRTVRHISG
jgi:hypothetical protein